MVTPSVIAVGIGMYEIFVKNKANLPISKGDFRPNGTIIKDILAVGIPSALTQATTSIVSGIISKIIAGFGTAAVSVYGGYSNYGGVRNKWSYRIGFLVIPITNSQFN